MRPFIEGPRSPVGGRTFYNGKYQAIVSGTRDEDGRPMVVLSMRREDRKHIMDWRDVQWVKNELLGPEVEAVQLFPAESRLIDTSNQYYLNSYGLDHRFPFGFTTRMVTENLRVQIAGHGSSDQRPFDEHVRPPDIESNEKLARLELQLMEARGEIEDRDREIASLREQLRKLQEEHDGR